MRLNASLALLCAPLALSFLAPARLASPARRSLARYNGSVTTASTLTSARYRPSSILPVSSSTANNNTAPNIITTTTPPLYRPPSRNHTSTLPCTASNCSTTTTTCINPAPGQPPISISVVYTSTITLMASNTTDYVPPFEPLTTPVFCQPAGVAPSELPPPADATSPHHSLGKKVMRLPVTFVTTDKNPSVSVQSDPPPRYSPTWSVNGAGIADGNHATAKIDDGNIPGGGGGGRGGGGGDHQQSGAPAPVPAPPRKGTADHDKPDGGNPRPRPTPPNHRPRRPTKDGIILTILPTAILGPDGFSVSKPIPPATAVTVATPRTALVDGLPVTVSGSEAVVGDATLTLKAAVPTSATASGGRLVVVRAGGLLVVDGSHTLSFGPLVPASRESDVLVHRGHLLTIQAEAGRAIVQDETYTYGPNLPPTTQTIDSDTLILAPDGISIHGLHLDLNPPTHHPRPQPTSVVTATLTVTPELGAALSSDTASATTAEASAGAAEAEEESCGSRVGVGLRCLVFAALLVGVFLES
ncbi:hypothetical protein GQ602_003998 [Ophiocordyceps camponoti-floridani]|uniref:Uncharacterized protein n=1 Tax=Ophiocordyceps camponoti-floridani TaxID=2030778 RepID=A0A8H4Q628_9HYPO|nr:hypothetical protein GQ602_003998 [Ophiocordyceps camponoti-floridani]